MEKLKWEPITDCDDENGNHTCYSAEINHPKYGRYVWLTLNNKNGFNVEINKEGEFVSLKECRSLESAKIWVAMILA